MAPSPLTLAVVSDDVFLEQSAESRVHAAAGTHHEREEDLIGAWRVLDADLDAVEMALFQGCQSAVVSAALPLRQAVAISRSTCPGLLDSRAHAPRRRCRLHWRLRRPRR